MGFERREFGSGLSLALYGECLEVGAKQFFVHVAHNLFHPSITDDRYVPRGLI